MKASEDTSRPHRLVALLMLGPVFAECVFADENLIQEYTHLGVASCASSVCHGKLQRQNERNVWLNEYRLWTAAGKHSQAYRLLESEESRKIANYLGLASATTAKICLDCHADNVPAEKRGTKFQIDDGVSCEACHGGAEEWIESHATDGATHENNLGRGMYPTEAPAERAKLCLSCHMGSPDKFAGHDIMGAGHPRISFELETFTANQPAHFEVDDDYRMRKGEIPGFNLWLTGQVESARRFVDLVRLKIDSNSGPYPELAFYDCHGCHHEMDDKRWTPVRGAGVRPGSLRLQDQHLLILQAVVSVLESTESRAELASASDAFVRAGQEDIARVKDAANGLIEWLAERQREWATRQFNTETVVAVRRVLVVAAARGQMNDFNAAEQIYLALESLSYTLGDRQRLADALDQIFAEVEDDSKFRPSSFAATARIVQGQF